jgi:hypothetical protein
MARIISYSRIIILVRCRGSLRDWWGDHVKKFGNHWSVSEQKLFVFVFGYHENCTIFYISLRRYLTTTLPGPAFFLCLPVCPTSLLWPEEVLTHAVLARMPSQFDDPKVTASPSVSTVLSLHLSAPARFGNSCCTESLCLICCSHYVMPRVPHCLLEARPGRWVS